MSFTIRPETPADAGAIRRVVAAAFGSDAEADLVERIRTSPEYVPELALVAVADEAQGGERVLGHVMISHALLVGEQGERRIAMLSPLATSPERQKSGIGGALVRAALDAANERREPLVVLEGDPAYYSRFGFEHSVPLGITLPLPDWAPSEAGQVARLDAYDADDPTLRGEVVYPAAFSGLE